MTDLVIAQEPWSEAFWREAEPLATAHFGEVAGELEPERPFKLDLALMAQLQSAGVLRLFSARVEDVLAAYITWNVLPDVESEGLIIAQQGAWYATPGYRAGAAVYRASLEALTAEGVAYAYPHHRNRGRGADLGPFFASLGAVKIQDTYSLRLGGS